ncbi:hypothetical protein [Azospirillum endophyticum]
MHGARMPHRFMSPVRKTGQRPPERHGQEHPHHYAGQGGPEGHAVLECKNEGTHVNGVGVFQRVRSFFPIVKISGRSTAVAQPRCRLPWTALPWLLSAASDRPVRREHPSACGQGARQRQAARATAAAGWMRSRSPLLGGPARAGCGVGNAAARVAAGDGWCVEDRSRCRGPAFRAGAWIAELCHGPHRREGSASFARVVVDRHDVSSR